jgi:carbonic anhydrase/acetyltransferase-like protein (isoleucine patch superfamily)
MTLEQRLKTYLGKSIKVDSTAFLAPGVVAMGDVEIGPRANIWYGAILRGDINSIRIGEGTNLQDGVIVHLADEFGVTVGKYNVIGHGAILHACEIGNECLIGMRATVLDGAKIGNQCLVAAHSLVPKGFTCPDGVLIMGTPAKVIRELTSEEKALHRQLAEKYIQVAQAHALKIKNKFN